VPDALPVPDDLVQLQHAYDTAYAEVNRFVASIDLPGHPPAAWTDDQRNHLEELRAAHLEAVLALHRHPTMAQARQTGCSHQTELARKKAARKAEEPQAQAAV
jgi:hypothetical protein